MLPDIPYKGGKVFSQLLDFKGLNLSENYTDGEFVESSNLSTRNYPCITQRRGLETLDGYVSPTDVFEWDGKLIVVDGTDLKYNGEKVGQVTPGKKQFAVVNTKLVIWPDMMILDLNSKDFRTIAPQETGTVSFGSSDSVSMSTTSTHDTSTQDISHTYGFNRGGDYVWERVEYVKAYESVTWIDGRMVTSGEHTRVMILTEESDPIRVGDILLFRKNDIQGNLTLNDKRLARDWWLGGEDISIVRDYGEVDETRYAVVTAVTSTAREAGDGSQYYERTQTYSLTFRIVRQEESPAFRSLFSVGDKISVSGCTQYPENNTADGKYLTVSAITDDTLTFSDAQFSTGLEYGTVTLKRAFPHLDYICESENRLWGVSNSAQNIVYSDGESRVENARVIYASALGMPERMFDFDGVDTDSYQVAVGSEGDFTGICNYNGVNCWKEKKLHRVYGSYPSEYYIGEYDIPGVANGSAHSLQIINEVLYYHGIYGIYAYNGNTPTLISYKLGPAPLTDAVSGSDGERLFLYAKRAGVGTLFTYDTLHGLWLADIIPGVTAFAAVGGKLYICANYEIKTFSDLAYEDFTWSVTFTPFFANVNANASTISSFNKKNFTRIHLRADMQLGSTLNVYVKYDNGEWQKVYTKEADSDVIIKVPIPISRCDHIQIKLDGTNGVTIRGLEREFARASHE